MQVVNSEKYQSFIYYPICAQKKVAQQLLAAAQVFGRQRGWKHLELGAPALPKWERTVAFYRSNGFFEIGPRLIIGL